MYTHIYIHLFIQPIYIHLYIFICIHVYISTYVGGGGVRAMIYALGALRAFSRMGVLAVVTYSASLSGSAWMQALWMSMLGRAEVF